MVSYDQSLAFFSSCPQTHLATTYPLFVLLCSGHRFREFVRRFRGGASGLLPSALRYMIIVDQHEVSHERLSAQQRCDGRHGGHYGVPHVLRSSFTVKKQFSPPEIALQSSQGSPLVSPSPYSTTACSASTWRPFWESPDDHHCGPVYDRMHDHGIVSSPGTMV